MAATSWISTSNSTDWVITSSSSATWTGSTYHYVNYDGYISERWYDPRTQFVFEGRVLDKCYQMDIGL